MAEGQSHGEVVLCVQRDQAALRVKLDRCTNLDAKDANGFSDPYVVFIFRGKKAKSKVRFFLCVDICVSINQSFYFLSLMIIAFDLSANPPFSLPIPKQTIKKTLNPVYKEEFAWPVSDWTGDNILKIEVSFSLPHSDF
jgi:hypothetical protein